MAHYLLVAHGLDDPADLVACVRRLVTDDSAAACTLLVTAIDRLPVTTGHTSAKEARARARGGVAAEVLRAEGLYLVRTTAGDGSPPAAVEDELRLHPDRYDAVVLCTPRRRGLRGWVEGDVRAQVEERTGLPVFHYSAGVSDPWARVPRPRIGWLSRLWQRTRLASPPDEPVVPRGWQLLPFLVLMALYLLGGLSLALFVDRGFLLNDVVALIVYTVVIGGLLLVLRRES